MIDVFLFANTPITNVQAALAGFDCKRVMVRNGGPTEVWQRTPAGWQQDTPGMTLFDDLKADYIGFVAYRYERAGFISGLVGDGMVMPLTGDEAAEWLAVMEPHRYAIEDAIGCSVNVETGGKSYVCAAPIFAISDFKEITDPSTALGVKILVWVKQIQDAGADQVGMSISV